MQRSAAAYLERELAEARTDPYDSHPALAERLAAIEDCPARRRVRLSWHAFGAPPEQGEERAATPPATVSRIGAPRAVTTSPQPGERWRLNVRLKRVHALHNPNAFDAELRALEDGIAANGYVRSARKAAQANERLEGHAWTTAIVFESARTRLRDAMRSATRA